MSCFEQLNLGGLAQSWESLIRQVACMSFYVCVCFMLINPPALIPDRISSISSDLRSRSLIFIYVRPFCYFFSLFTTMAPLQFICAFIPSTTFMLKGPLSATALSARERDPVPVSNPIQLMTIISIN